VPVTYQQEAVPVTYQQGAMPVTCQYKVVPVTSQQEAVPAVPAAALHSRECNEAAATAHLSHDLQLRVLGCDAVQSGTTLRLTFSFVYFTARNSRVVFSRSPNFRFVLYAAAAFASGKEPPVPIG
jgi:hypothetical protein